MIQKYFHGECTGGGDLAFYGTNLGDLHMFCTHADGRVAAFDRKDPMFIEIPE